MKKFKLFASICSLFLSVAIMAFGVYAAQNATLTISSSVTYVVRGIYVDAILQVEGCKSQANNVRRDYSTSKETTRNEDVNTWNDIVLDFDQNSPTITITFSVAKNETTSSKPFKVIVTNPLVLPSPQYVSAEVYENKVANTPATTKNATNIIEGTDVGTDGYHLKIVLTLNNFSHRIAGSALSFNLTLAP